MKIARVVVLVLATLPTAPLRADAPGLPDDVRAALEKNARSLSDLRIVGTRGRRMLAPAREALKALGTRQSEASFTQLMKFELRIQGAKLYESTSYPPGKYHSGDDLIEHAYDGTKHYSGSLNTSDSGQIVTLRITEPAIHEAKDETKATQGIIFEFWYLVEAGFNGADSGSEMGRPIESLVLARAAAGRLESVKGVGQGGQKLLEVVVAYPEPWASRATGPIEKDPSLQVFTGKSKEFLMGIERERRQLVGQWRLCRFLLDGGMGYAVREKWESRSAGGAVMFHTTNSDFQQVEPGGVWLPRRCEVVSHALGTAPRYISPEPRYATDIQIEKIERTTFSDDQFRIWYGQPGARVTDYTHPKATPGHPYDYVIAAPLQDPGRGGFAVNNRWLFIIALNSLVVAILVLAWYLRSRPHAQGGVGHTS